MSFKPIDAKRDEYRKYLEQTGVMELLSKVFVKLFECPDKPANAIDFIRENFGNTMLETDTIEHLKRELEDSRNEVAQLKRTLENLKLENSKSSAVAAAAAASVPAEASITSSVEVDNTSPAEVDTVPAESKTAAATIPAVEKPKVVENAEEMESAAPAVVAVVEEKKDVTETVDESIVEEQNKEQITESIKTDSTIVAVPSATDENNQESSINQQDMKVEPKTE